jgi:hypothetical protein
MTTTTSNLPATTWSEILPGSAFVCSRGDPYSFFFYPGTTNNVIITFEGGNSCYDYNSCDTSTHQAYNITTYQSRENLRYNNYTGFFYHPPAKGAATYTNPFATWSHLYIPLCTADSHLGNATVTYDAGATVQHKGGLNANQALQWLFTNYPAGSSNSPQSIIVTGWSGGATGAAWWSPTVMQNYPNAHVVFLEDSQPDVALFSPPLTPSDAGAGIYAYNQAVLSKWGVANSPVVPTWLPSFSLTSTNFTSDSIISAMGAHYPNSTIVRYSPTTGPVQPVQEKLLFGNQICVNPCDIPGGNSSSGPNTVTLTQFFTDPTAAGVVFCNGLQRSSAGLTSSLGNTTNFHEYYVTSGISSDGVITSSDFYHANGTGISDTLADWLQKLVQRDATTSSTIAC